MIHDLGTYLHHTNDIWAPWDSDVWIPDVDEIPRSFHVLQNVSIMVGCKKIKIGCRPWLRHFYYPKS